LKGKCRVNGWNTCLGHVAGEHVALWVALLFLNAKLNSQVLYTIASGPDPIECDMQTVFDTLDLQVEGIEALSLRVTNEVERIAAKHPGDIYCKPLWCCMSSDAARVVSNFELRLRLQPYAGLCCSSPV